MREMELVKKILEDKVDELEKIRVKIIKSLEKAPEGNLVLSTSNKTIQYYHKKDKKEKKGKYISRNNVKLISALAQKDYDIAFLKDIEKDIKTLEKIQKSISTLGAWKVYEKLAEGRRKFIKPHFLTDEQYIEKWLEVKYEGKTFAIDAPVILTEKGERVRSKTEKIIADKLYAMDIPYRYEYPVRLKCYGKVYPDFTLLNIKTRKEIYLEHFGMMDNPGYCEMAVRKINEYIESGFRVGENFLFTFETSRQPLNMMSVEKTIRDLMQ